MQDQRSKSELLRYGVVHSCKPHTEDHESSPDHVLTVQQMTALPIQPGIYIFRDAEMRPLYVGKAKSLRSRIRSYVYKERLRDPRIVQMTESARYLETIITRTEGEALDLEGRLIKQMLPPYNILLRDDKSYPYVRLEVQPGYARVTVSHGKDNQGTYFGPFFPAGLAHDAVTFVRRHLLPSEDPDWIQWSTDYEAKMDLRRRVEWVRKVLAGNIGTTARLFTRQMESAVQAGRFEEAARCRNCLRVLKALRAQARAAAVPNRNVDFAGIFRRDSLTAFNIFRFRHGGLSDRFQMIVRDQQPENELLLLMLRHIYNTDPLPDQIVVPGLLRNDILSKVPGLTTDIRGVPFVVPKGNSDGAWSEIAIKNARALLEGWIGQQELAVTNEGPIRQDTPNRKRSKESDLDRCGLGEGNKSSIILNEHHTTYLSISTSNAFQRHSSRSASAATKRSSPGCILTSADLRGQFLTDASNMNTKRNWSM